MAFLTNQPFLGVVFEKFEGIKWGLIQYPYSCKEIWSAEQNCVCGLITIG